MLKNIKYWLDETHPSTQALVASTLGVIVIGFLIAGGLAWYRPALWLSAVAMGCSSIAIGLSVLSIK